MSAESKLFEIHNPSDPYTFRAEDYEIAALVGVLLGEGMYPIEEIGGEWRMPFFGFGGAEEWWSKTFGKTIKESLAEMETVHAPTLATALDSVLSGSPGSRMTFEDAVKRMQPKDVEEFRAKYHDDRRTSLNDIGGLAQKLKCQFVDGRKAGAR